MSALRGMDTGSSVELDSHADTCVVGRSALIFHEHDRTVMVNGFDPSFPDVRAKIVDAAVLYVDQSEMTSYILEFNQALSVPSIDHCLLCPMQCRINGVEIDEKPRFLTSTPTVSSHSISFPNAEDSPPLNIPLQLEGVVSYFPIRRPTQEEFEDRSIPHLSMTAESPPWDPYDEDFACQEGNTLDSRGHLIAAMMTNKSAASWEIGDVSPDDFYPRRNLSEELVQTCAAGYLDDSAFSLALEESVQVSLVQSSLRNVHFIASVRSGKGAFTVDGPTLAQRWDTTLMKSTNTVKVITQRGVRTVLHPTLSQKFKTNDRFLQYRQIPSDMNGDAMFSSVKSSLGNTAAQIFCTNFA
jgi:hypothetical protein